MGRISFDRSLYIAEAVEAAATAYADYADIALERSNDAVIAVVGDVRDVDRDTLEHSFCNFVLQETVVRMRRTAAPETPGGPSEEPPGGAPGGAHEGRST